MSTDERMEKIEGQLARMRWINRCLIACIALSLGVWFILKTFGPDTARTQPGAKEIRANGFILEDENGKTRADLTFSNNRSVLSLKDENGKTRVELGVFNAVPMLSLNDENEKLRAWLTLGSLTLFGENYKGRAALTVLDNGPMLSMQTVRENRTQFGAWLSAGKNGAWLSLGDENQLLFGKNPVDLSVDKDGACLLLRDQNGTPRAMLGTGQTTTSDGKVITYPESSLFLFGADGKGVWSAP